MNTYVKVYGVRLSMAGSRGTEVTEPATAMQMRENGAALPRWLEGCPDIRPTAAGKGGGQTICPLPRFHSRFRLLGFGNRNNGSCVNNVYGRSHSHSNYLDDILNLSEIERARVSKRHLNALGSWLALRVSGRVVLPMVINAGSFLRLKRFDWVKDKLSHKQFVQVLPSIYSAWCTALLDCIEQVQMYMWGELERYLRQLGMTRDEFVRALSQTGKHSSGGNAGTLSPTVCTHCNDDYSHLAGGLVEPACIAIAECVKTAHDSDCVCDNIARINIPSDDHSDYTGRCETDDDNGSDTDENVEFFDAQPQMFSDIDFEGKYSHDVFNDTATLLYSAQGREQLCSTCLLLKEKYIGEDGLAADFPPMPTGFQGLRVKW